MSVEEAQAVCEPMNKAAIGQPRISVVVPVWNPGPGISRCIESLRSQTLKDIEIIFVDDRGTDDAMETVRKAAAEDHRIRIIENEENIGSGPSRNKGIAAAKGEYLSFIDPDDYVAANFYEKLYIKAKAEALDIAKGTTIYEKEDGAIVRRDRDLNLAIRRGLEERKPLYLVFTYEHQSAIYRREMLIANDVRYGTSRRAQDTTFLLAACMHANRFALAQEARYHFCERSDSAMHTMNTGMLVAVADAFREHVDVFMSVDTRKEDEKKYLLSIVNTYLREPLRYEGLDSGNGQEDANKAVQEFAKEMEKQIKRLPFYEELAEKSFSIQALLKYGVVLPRAPYVSPWDNATPRYWCAAIKKWADFLEAHPKCRNACKCDVVRLLLRIYILKRKSAASEAETQAWTQEMKELMTEIKRFPKSVRREAYLWETVRVLIPDSVKAFVKRMVR